MQSKCICIGQPQAYAAASLVGVAPPIPSSVGEVVELEDSEDLVQRSKAVPEVATSKRIVCEPHVRQHQHPRAAWFVEQEGTIRPKLDC